MERPTWKAGPSAPPTRRQVLAGLGGLAGGLLVGCSDRDPGGGRPLPSADRPDVAPGTRPNIVVILSDDHRWDHASFHPDAPAFLATPALDALAARGAVMGNAFVTTALCSPSRGTFLTGTWASVHGVRNNLTAWDPSRTTFFEPLQAAGYDTAFIGKWHMPGALPDLRGLDRFITFTAEGGQGRYVDCPLLIDGGYVERPGSYLTEDLTDLALEWLGGRGERPWCLYLAHKAVHHEWIPPAHLRGTLDGLDLSDLPDEAFSFLSLMDRNIWEGTRGRLETLYQAYCETLLGLDEQIGRLLAALDDDTYVVYASDNGYSWGEHVLTGKRWAYEENTRVPFVVAGPGIAPGARTDLVLNADLAPTLLEWAGADPLPDAQGRSFAPLLRAGGTAGVVAWRDDFLYEYFPDFPYQTPGMRAVRDERWLYVEFDADRDPELYDVLADPRTQRTLAADEPERVAAMSARLAELRDRVETGEPV